VPFTRPLLIFNATSDAFFVKCSSHIGCNGVRFLREQLCAFLTRNSTHRVYIVLPALKITYTNNTDIQETQFDTVAHVILYLSAHTFHVPTHTHTLPRYYISSLFLIYNAYRLFHVLPCWCPNLWAQNIVCRYTWSLNLTRYNIIFKESGHNRQTCRSGTLALSNTEPFVVDYIYLRLIKTCLFYT
jgi:hypothetical protein